MQKKLAPSSPTVGINLFLVVMGFPLLIFFPPDSLTLGLEIPPYFLSAFFPWSP